MRIAGGILALALLATSTVAQVAPATFTAGGQSPAGTVADDYWQSFARAVTEKSAGAIQPKLLTRGEVGSEEQILTATRRGRIQVAINGMLSLSSAVPELAVLMAPYLFDSKEEMAFIVERHLTPLLAPMFDRNELVLLRVLPMGWMHIYSRNPALTPADLKSRRVRVPTDAASRLYQEALGFDLIPLASTDVVQSLQAGLTEAGSTVTLNYVWSGISSVAPHLTLTGHSFVINALFANKSWWMSLSPAARTAIETSAGSGRDFSAALDATEDTLLRQATENGFTVHTLTLAQRAQWSGPAAEVRKQLTRDIGGQAQDLVDAVAAGKKAFAALGQ